MDQPSKPDWFSFANDTAIEYVAPKHIVLSVTQISSLQDGFYQSLFHALNIYCIKSVESIDQIGVRITLSASR